MKTFVVSLLMLACLAGCSDRRSRMPAGPSVEVIEGTVSGHWKRSRMISQPAHMININRTDHPGYTCWVGVYPNTWQRLKVGMQIKVEGCGETITEIDGEKVNIACDYFSN